MARNDIGTVDEERLVPLLADEDGFRVDVTAPVRRTDVPEEGTFAWLLGEVGDVPRLAAAPVEDADEAGALPTRELSRDDEALALPVPEHLLDAGLGLDVESYDDGNALLFDPGELDGGVPVGMTPEGEPAGTADVALELVPVRYADGTPYDAAPAGAASFDSDPVAEAAVARRRGEGATPRAESLSAPLDAEVVDEVLEGTDAPRSDVLRALETVARRDLVGQEDDAADGPPLTAEERAVVAVDEDVWRDEVVPELDAEAAVAEAVRRVHARQAERLVEWGEGEGERFDDRVPVVVRPDRTYDEGSEPEWYPE